MDPRLGIAGQPAPELRADWLRNVDGEQLQLADIHEPVIYLYNFQSWCPGCHSRGFPTMKAVKARLDAVGKADQVKFVAIQTVFEGHDVNTPEAALESLDRHGLTDVAVGHDSGNPPATMVNYRTGGTPWTVIIGPDREVITNGFHIETETTIEIIDKLLADVNTASSNI